VKKTMYAYLIGIDGGGTGTRVQVVCSDGTELARGSGGPSGLFFEASAIIFPKSGNKGPTSRHNSCIASMFMRFSLFSNIGRSALSIRP
jgi:hypothetical protein